MRNALRLQRADGGERREHRIAIVGASSSIKFAVLQEWVPGTEAIAPPAHLGLLVQVPIQHDGAITGSGHVEIQQRRAPRQAHDLHRQSAHRLCFDPRLGEADHAFDVPVRCPLRVEMR
jgi:hypothetical protein